MTLEQFIERFNAHGNNLTDSEMEQGMECARVAAIAIRNLCDVAHRHGWNGVENSKILWRFFDHEIDRASIVPELLEALKAARPRLAHRYDCMSVLPTEQWRDRGSVVPDSCTCEIAIVDAAITKAEGRS
jgi:hypothetical protein